AARLDQRPPGPLPAPERGRRHLGRGGSGAERAVPVDRLRAVVRIRRGPHRRRGMAAAPVGRLTGGTMASMRVLRPAGYLADRAAGRWAFEGPRALLAWAAAGGGAS